MGVFDFLSDTMNSSVEMSRDAVDVAREKQERKDAQKREDKAEFEELSTFTFSEDPAEIQNALQSFVSKAVGTKKGLFASAQDKKIMAVLKEKIEFGIMQLSSAGKTAEAAFFQKKLDELNGKK